MRAAIPTDRYVRTYLDHDGLPLLQLLQHVLDLLPLLKPLHQGGLKVAVLVDPKLDGEVELVLLPLQNVIPAFTHALIHACMQSSIKVCVNTLRTPESI